MNANATTEKEPRVLTRSRLRENIEAILFAILLALFIRTFIVQAFKIPSGSMKQTLQIGDHILVNKFIYGVKIPYLNKTVIPVSKPDRGDIVVFKFPVDPEKDFIKRVVAVAGDVVESRSKTIFVNNEKVEENYSIRVDPNTYPATIQARDNFGPLKVPEHAVFVMGDNRDQSFDSRFWGFVDLQVVSGKAFMIYWSWDKDKFGVRWRRLGSLLK